MPELPEVETITRQLEKVLVGQKIIKVEALSKKSFVGQESDVEGKQIKSVRRKAKMTIIDLGGLYLLIHLKMTGQLVYQATNSKHTRVVLHLSQGKLIFNDLRLFGWMKVVDKKGLEKEFKHYGPDIIDKAVTQEYFYGVLQKSRRALKLVIIDQAKVAGVGNIYANEGLWRAGINPGRLGNQVNRAESDKLLECLREVINKGIKYGGATARDENYVNAAGLGGKYQEHFLVYEQAGKKCHRCKSIIKKIRLGGRGTYFCPGCQR
jgi:formamidopyrimidine-DNA glycosylase